MVVMEGRVSRAREQQEGMIYALKKDQDKFQEELRSTLTAFQSVHLATAEYGNGVENNGESSMKGGCIHQKGQYLGVLGWREVSSEKEVLGEITVMEFRVIGVIVS